MASAIKKRGGRKAPATAFQMQSDDGLRVVGVGNLRVMIYTEGDGVWIAQGLELDYTAQGASLREAQKRFEDGLSASLHANVRVFDNISNFLRPAPPDVWQRFFHGIDCSKHRFSLLSAQLKSLPSLLPFQGINYYAPAEAPVR